jgi:hypothetical protein
MELVIEDLDRSVTVGKIHDKRQSSCYFWAAKVPNIRPWTLPVASKSFVGGGGWFLLPF